MPVFIITTQSGERFKLIADDLADARVKAASRTAFPAASLDIKQVADARNRSDQQVAAGVDLPELTLSVRDGRIGPARDLRAGEGTVSPNTQRVTRNSFTEAQRDAGVRRSFSIAPEEVSGTSDAAGGGRIVGITPTGVGPNGGITFGGGGGGGGGVDDDLTGQPDTNSITVDTHLTDPSLTVIGTGGTSGVAGGTSAGAGAVPNQPTPGEILGSGDFAAFAGVPLQEREQLLPGSAFDSFLASRAIRQGSVGSLLPNAQFGRAATLFSNINALGLNPEGRSFTEFLGAGPLGNFSGAARGILAALQGGQGQLPEDFQVFGDEGSFTTQAQSLANLARIGQGSGLGAGLFSPTNSQLERRLQNQAFSGRNPEFLSFLQSAFSPIFGQNSQLAGIGFNR